MQNTNYNICYVISAISLTLLIALIYNKRKTNGLRGNQALSILILVTIIGNIFDFLSSIAILNARYCPRQVTIIFTYGYFLFHSSISFAFILYVFSLTNTAIKDTSNAIKTALFAPILLQQLLIATNFFTGAVFTINDQISYTRGNAQWFIYVVVFYYLIWGLWIIAHGRMILIRDILIAICTFICICGGCTIIQFLYPNLLLESYGISLCLLLLTLSLHQSDSLIDPVVAVFNIKTFSRVFDALRKNNKKTTIIVLCIDDLKLLQSILGITKTNTILRHIAKFLEKLTVKNLYYLELGTFALVVQNSLHTTAEALTNKIEERFSNGWKYDNTEIALTYRQIIVSVPDDARDLETFYAYTDYVQNLTNTTCDRILAKNVNLTNLQRKIIVASCIKNALEKNLFQIFYQPIISAKTGQIISAEALIRLPDENYGFISPVEFIPLAERNGSILQIGRFVLDSVFKFIHDHLQETGMKYIEINLSPIQCMQESITTQIFEFIERYSISPESICLEITETAATSFSPLILRNMCILHDEGIHFALDAYGSCYSSINSIIDIPLDSIKFDKSMIDAMTANTDKGKMIFESSVAMIQKMNLSIIAEGIECKKQSDLLQKYGIDYLQGFYYSRPLPEQSFLEYCKKIQNRPT